MNHKLRIANLLISEVSLGKLVETLLANWQDTMLTQGTQKHIKSLFSTKHYDEVTFLGQNMLITIEPLGEMFGYKPEGAS